MHQAYEIHPYLLDSGAIFAALYREGGELEDQRSSKRNKNKNELLPPEGINAKKIRNSELTNQFFLLHKHPLLMQLTATKWQPGSLWIPASLPSHSLGIPASLPFHSLGHSIEGMLRHAAVDDL